VSGYSFGGFVPVGYKYNPRADQHHDTTGLRQQVASHKNKNPLRVPPQIPNSPPPNNKNSMLKTSLLLSILTALDLPLASQGFVAPNKNIIGKRHFGDHHNFFDSKNNHRVETALNVDPASENNEKVSGKSQKSAGSSFNFGLIAQNLGNQALIGSTIWTGGLGYEVLMDKAHFGPVGLLLGVAGLVPLLALSRAIETSESYLASGLNLSTNAAVLRLFGPSPQPIAALVVSAIMAGLTGLVEEVTFRGMLIPALATRVGDGDILTGAVLSTFLFAFLHTNPGSFLKGGDAARDNAVLLALQLVNGGIFALLYLTTDNLAVPIVAHALYDLYIFYKTHLVDVAGQMEYASRESMMPSFSSPALENKWIQQKGEDFVRGVKETFYLMDTNRDGVLSRKELRVALFSYGINLSMFQSEEVSQAADLDASGGIDLDEFIEFVGPSGSTGKAVRNTLFGPI
jgi:membrane protease YdiL (CAAX protease family)